MVEQFFGRKMLAGIIVVLLGVIVYLLFFQEHPCDAQGRLMAQGQAREQRSETLSPEEHERFMAELLAAVAKCK